jgi:hypothetical protein
LSHVKQEENETLRSYIRHFFKMRATITNITDEDVIHCFQNSLGSKNMYYDFGRNRPKTIVELHDMMQRWPIKRMRRTSASPSATTTSITMVTAPTKASGTTRNPLESASQTTKSWL